MGAEASKGDAQGGGGGPSLASEIIRLKAARQAGWLTQEEYDMELKRVIKQFNGGDEAKVAYAFEDVINAGLAEPGSESGWTDLGLEQKEAELDPEQQGDGMVELDLDSSRLGNDAGYEGEQSMDRDEPDNGMHSLSLISGADA